MARITVSAPVLAEVFAHCEGAYPEEACGVLTGPAGQALADRFSACANIQNDLHREDPAAHRDARTAYRIAPTDLFRLTRECRDAGREFKGIVHSHADVGAYFSDEDQRQAAPSMTLSVPVFARGEGISEGRVAELVAAGRVTGAGEQVTARIPTYPELVYLVVDVSGGRALDFKGFVWDAEPRTYVETVVAVNPPSAGGVS